jgi:hypothetical protein
LIGGVARGNAEEAPFARDTFEMLLASLYETDARPSDKLSDRSRDQNLTARRAIRNPRRYVDGQTLECIAD